MFDNLSEKLGGILDRLTGRGALSEKDVDAAMREVRRALLEADVSLDVVRSFTDRVREQAIGATVVKSVTPGQMVVKIVHDELVKTLGSDGETIDINAVPPVPIMMVGLQGSGKTTTTAKLARRLVQRDKRKVLMASLDVYRPAAMEQLAVLGRDLDIPTLPIIEGQKPPQIAKRALEAGKLGGYDVVLLDTAGRTTLDDEMMREAAEIKAAANPHEVLLVADSLTRPRLRIRSLDFRGRPCGDRGGLFLHEYLAHLAVLGRIHPNAAFGRHGRRSPRQAAFRRRVRIRPLLCFGHSSGVYRRLHSDIAAKGRKASRRGEIGA